MNTTHTKDMTVGTPWRLIASFAFPVFLSHVFQQLYNTADSLIVGKYLGTDSLAAVSSSGPLIFLMVSFFSGTAMGGSVVISRYFGARDEKTVSRAVHTTVAFGLTSGVIMTIIPMFVAYFFARRICKLQLLNSLGSITGGMTSTPALGTLIGVAGTDDVASAYASTYPIALVLIVLASNLIGTFLG